ncbi:MAG: hypothetical protein J6N72_05585 [Psychrobacter sp.]|nr:hypothetical protein [Psychrobacter sp.]
MNLYYIKNINEIGYDHYEGHVIAARNESEVRNIAAQKTTTEKTGEGAKTWLGSGSTVTLIGIAASDITNPTVILSAFRNG